VGGGRPISTSFCSGPRDFTGGNLLEASHHQQQFDLTVNLSFFDLRLSERGLKNNRKILQQYLKIVSREYLELLWSLGSIWSQKYMVTLGHSEKERLQPSMY